MWGEVHLEGYEIGHFLGQRKTERAATALPPRAFVHSSASSSIGLADKGEKTATFTVG